MGKHFAGKSRKIWNSKVALIFFLISIFLFSLAIRISGISFGLPYEYIPDESSPHIISAVKVLQSKNLTDFLNVNIGTYPRFYWYILAVFFKVASLLHLPAGFPAAITDQTDWYKMMVFIRQNAIPIFITSRFCSAFLAAFVPVLCFFIAKRLFKSSGSGVLAACLVSFDFLLVKDAHYTLPDSVLSLFIVLALFFTIKYFDEPNSLYVIVGSFFAGICFAIKYNTVLIFLPIVVVLFINGKRIIRQKTSSMRGIFKFTFLFLCCLMIFVGLFIFSNPIVLTDFSAFLGGLEEIQKMYASGMLGKIGPFGYHLFAYGWDSTFETLTVGTFIFDTNLVGVIFGILVIFLGIFKRNLKIILFSLFPILYYLLIDVQRLKAVRQLLVIAPLLIILASDIMSSEIISRRKLHTFLMVLLLASSFFTFSRSVYFDFLLNQEDTRTIAKEWIMDNISKGSEILLFGDYSYLPPINKPDYNREYYQAPYYNFDNAVLKDRAKPISYFINKGYEYFIISSYNTQNYYCKSTQIYFPQTYQSYKEFYSSFDERTKLVYQTDVNRYLHPGPVIKIYKVLH